MSARDQETHVEPSQPTSDEIIAEAQRRMSVKQEGPETPVSGEQKATRQANRVVYWLARHWLATFNTLIGIFVLGAFLAPILMQSGAGGPAALLYRLYGPPVCHQYPVRSWFLFGEEAAYPEESPLLPDEVEKHREFVGDEQLGYKVGFCQRDVAIYSTMLLAGLLFGIVRRFRKVPPLPLWALIVFGILPMGLDGGYQLLTNLLAYIRPGLISAHETTPFLRTLTGALFGFTTIAFAYPNFEEFFNETKSLLAERYNWS